MALSQTPCPKSPSRRFKLRYAVLALMVAGVLKTCQNDTHDRVMAATDSSISAPRPKPRGPQVTRVATTPEADSSSEETPDSESLSTEQNLSYYDSRLEVFARLQECAPDQDWHCSLEASSRTPFWVYPAYADPTIGGPFDLRLSQQRSITCTLDDFDNFPAYIAVDSWTTQIDISHSMNSTAYFAPIPFLLSPTDPCDALALYREQLLDTAELQMEALGDLLWENGFDEEDAEGGPYCFTQSFFYPAEALDTAVATDTAHEIAEDEEVIRICFSENGLWCRSEFSLNGGDWEDSRFISVAHPEELLYLASEELSELALIEEPSDSGL